MKKNVGYTDRWIRYIIGILLLSLLFIDFKYSYLGYLGLIPILTGSFRFCPLYSLFRMNTCKVKK